MKELDEFFCLVIDLLLCCTYRNIVLLKQGMHQKVIFHIFSYLIMNVYLITPTLYCKLMKKGIFHSLRMQYQNLSDLIDF